MQVVHVTNPDVASAANLTLLSQHYFALDKSIYTDWRMAHVRRKWMKQQMETPDELGGLTCAICGRKGLKPWTTPKATLDHIVNIGHGGAWNDPSNFQVACEKCNNDKNSKLQKEERSSP